MNRFLPFTIFLAATAVGLGMTYSVYKSTLKAEMARFEIVADEAADRIHERVNLHIALLIATRSLFVATAGNPTRTIFRDYMSGLDLRGRFEGIQGIGFARMIASSQSDAIEAGIRRDYAVDTRVRPETTEAFRTPIILLEPFDQRNRKAIGYDMFSEKNRRNAMLRAIETDTPQSSAPVELVQEIDSDKQSGFLVYLSLKRAAPAPLQSEDPGSAVQGFVYAPFRSGDLHNAALDRQPRPAVIVETHDTTATNGISLYQSPDFDEVVQDSRYLVKRQLDIAGREWTVSLRERPEFRSQVSFISVYLLGAISLFFAAALAVSTRSQLRSIETVRKLNSVSQKAVSEKDLMLQEMKHRIKNSLSRVLAIARQTASNSRSLDEFTTSFSARMQSMANAQDMLTRSEWQRGNLRELLESELTQVFGASIGDEQLTGPEVDLDERAIQALGLTFHELATNAMKYGALAHEDGQLQISWSVSKQRKGRQLLIEWTESFPGGATEPTRRGFGSRLIDVNVQGELGGEVRRRFDGDGMSIQIIMPLIVRA